MTARYFLLLTRPKIVFVNAESAKCLEQVIKENNLNTKLVFSKLARFEDASLTSILRSQDDTNSQRIRVCKIVQPWSCRHNRLLVRYQRSSERYRDQPRVHDQLHGSCQDWRPLRTPSAVVLWSIHHYQGSSWLLEKDHSPRLRWSEETCRFIEKYETSAEIN